MIDLLIILVSQCIDWQKLLIGIKAEMLAVVVREINGVRAVAHDKKLHEAQQGVGVTIARIAFVVHNLLHGPARAYLQRLEFNLDKWKAIYQEYNVKPMMAILRIDAKLADYLKFIFAPLFKVDERVV